MAPPSSNARVAQLPKFAVVQVMIDLNGRECLSSDQWEIKDAFWRAVLYRLNELYPDNVSEVRTVNHVKRTWSALRQRVLQRYQSHNREILPSDLRVLYLVGEVDSYDESQLPNQQPSIPLSMTQTSSFFEDSPLLSLDYLRQSPAPSSQYQNRREDRCESPRAGGSRTLGLKRRLVMCQIEREKAQTKMLKAKRRLIEAQIRNLEKNGSVDLRFSIDTLDN